MIDTAYKIMAFSQLGKELKDFVEKIKSSKNLNGEEKQFYAFIQQAKHYNGWFDEATILNALSGLSFMMDKTKMQAWIEHYKLKKDKPKKVGLILAGNIPFVGWHDILSVIMGGNIAVIKPSSDDAGLTKALIDYLLHIAIELEEQIQFADKLKNIDAIIATGSNNSQRYFEQYFSRIPHVFRKNRNAVAVLNGNETKEELSELADDMLAYYGLGCRNVSKIYLPGNYDLNKIFEAVYENFQAIMQHKKYANNFDYHKAIYVMNQIKVLENGIVILKEDNEISSPVSVCYYEYYNNLSKLLVQLDNQKNNIQCIVSNCAEIRNAIPFGKAQSPKITDYADGVDTMDFLTNL